VRLLAVLLFTVFVGFGVGSASAQKIEDYASTAPAEPWVVVQEIPEFVEDVAPSSGVRYLLADYQSKEMLDGRRRYERYADQLITGSAVEENSTITIRFDPSFQTVIVHSVKVIRDGVVLDRLNLRSVRISPMVCGMRMALRLVGFPIAC